MTSTQQRVSPLRQCMTDDRRMRQLSPKNQTAYPRSVREFARYLERSPDTATVEYLRSYQLHRVDHGISPISLSAAITRLKFFFEITVQKPELMARMQPVRVPRTLPVVLSPDEVRRVIAATGNLKHQTALSVAYGTGWRASEVIALKVGDIEFPWRASRFAPQVPDSTRIEWAKAGPLAANAQTVPMNCLIIRDITTSL